MLFFSLALSYSTLSSINRENKTTDFFKGLSQNVMLYFWTVYCISLQTHLKPSSRIFAIATVLTDHIIMHSCTLNKTEMVEIFVFLFCTILDE